MNYERSHRRLISGQHTGLGAGLLRFLLSVAAIGYSVVVRLRNFLYSKGWLKAHHVDAAVICIGNITTGGTGKTPLVICVYKQIIENFKSQISNPFCAILTRGYKARRLKSKRNTQYAIRNTETDEIAILTEGCPAAKVVVNPDRVAGAKKAINEFGAKVLIMDDGFQHQRLARDLDIVTIDATLPFGYGKMLPAGLLREPVTSLKRAHAVVITRCDQITEAELDELENRLREIHPDIVVARSIHAPLCVEYPDTSVIPAKAGIQKDNDKVDSCLRRNDNIKQLKGKKIFAFCGIGNPEAFMHTIRSLECELVGSKVYDDHFHYTNDCLSEISSQAENRGADLILTTQKDWTKLISDFKSEISDSKSPVPFAYLAVEIEFLSGRDELTALIENTLQGRISQSP